MTRILVMLALFGLSALTGCVRPEITVCGQAGACVIHVCEQRDTCVAKPLELKP